MSGLRPEYSAQRMDASPNPMLGRCIDAIGELYPAARSIADQGCGKLRHLSILRANYRRITLVDLERQLSRIQRLNGKVCTVRELVGRMNADLRPHMALVAADEFARSRLALDVIFTVATFDVVPARTRGEMAAAAYRNLAAEGLYAVIVPRNDSSILKRCNSANKYKDGHRFKRGSMVTFYRNFRDSSVIVRLAGRHGFVLEADLSCYRQVGLIFRKT